VNIGVLGGGPAGLYFALLMKQADPAHQIQVVERNAPDATFGWGVVFSPDTITELRDADYETFVRLSDELVHWDAIDIRLESDVIRSSGQGFSAISRKTLLRILQERCGELGVDLEFEREMDDLSEWSDRDVIVAADGVNSFVRRRYETAFRPTYRVHPTRYIWFGTDLVFDAFTFIFLPTPDGLFQVHAYPFSSEMSTFIVETTEDVWRRAGLDDMDEEGSLEYCQDLFADHLGGHRLYSNRSAWTNFVTLACESWHHEGLVLVGDAVHTAHFSIGSGTKLAVEDAVALVKAFREHPDDVEVAFAAYESERQPPVVRFQAAARESSGYFEHVSRYLGFVPEQFAFNLLTRSGRVTHRSLELRDPLIVAAAERSFRERTAQRPTDLPWSVGPPPRLTKLEIGERTLVNRMALAPAPTDTSVDGLPGDGVRRRLMAAGATGVGLIVTEAVAVTADGRVTSGSAGLYGRAHVDAWAEIVSEIHELASAAIAVRLAHAGRRGATRPRDRGIDRPLSSGGWPLVAASPIPYHARSQVPKQLDRGQMDEIRDAFRAGARRAAEAGFDVVIVDAGSGYLLGGFVSPLTNRRDDGYGGDTERRLRYPLEVVTAIRDVWSGPLGVRVTATDWRARGTTLADAVTIAARFRDAGADFIDVAGGQTVFVAYPEYRRQYLVPFSDQIRNEADTPTMVSGNITTFDQVDTILAAGRADLCVLNPWIYEASPYRSGGRREPGLRRSFGNESGGQR
jgi:anthraniloyl-CoA monooxygenase